MCACFNEGPTVHECVHNILIACTCLCIQGDTFGECLRAWTKANASASRASYPAYQRVMQSGMWTANFDAALMRYVTRLCSSLTNRHAFSTDMKSLHPAFVRLIVAMRLALICTRTDLPNLPLN